MSDKYPKWPSPQELLDLSDEFDDLPASVDQALNYAARKLRLLEGLCKNLVRGKYEDHDHAEKKSAWHELKEILNPEDMPEFVKGSDREKVAKLRGALYSLVLTDGVPPSEYAQLIDEAKEILEETKDQ